MGNAVDQSIAGLPNELQPYLSLWFEKLADQNRTLPDALVEPTARIVACSEFAAKTLQREFDWFVENATALDAGVDNAELHRFVESVATSDADPASIKSQLRRFRNRFMLAVLWRELNADASLDETLRQLSLLADRFLDAAARYAERQLRKRFGKLRSAAGDVVPLVVLGMGKLGGHELNFSSDIDLIFCYSENGESDGGRSLSAQEYFARLTREIIALIDERTVDGFAFRIDTRLRPFGDSGPPVVSFAALESYLLQHGRDWERYAYVKARIVGPQPEPGIAKEMYSDLIQPFVYRRYLDYGVFESVREMQEMIAAEVRRRDLADNLKLGPGGIREAEFIVQALQLVRGGSEKELQCRQLQLVLPKLVSDRGLNADDASKLRSAYRFLRRAENYIQAIRDQQTHDLPHSDIDKARLCLAMRCDSWDELTAALDRHREAISTLFGAIAIRERDDQGELRKTFGVLWESGADRHRWQAVLGKSLPDDAAELAQQITAFAASSATQQIDAVSNRRLQRYLPNLLGLIVESKRPASALSRILAVTSRILRRSAYLALLNENEAALSRLVDLCSRSQYIADQIARYPALLDELLDPGSYSEQLCRDDIAEEMRNRLDDDMDSEARVHAIAQFQRSAMFRIAVADFNGELPIMKVSDGLTWLAEVVLEEALRVAWSDMIKRHGVPTYLCDGVRHEAGFGIVGYGKLGGLELSYGSDLDIVFLHNSGGEEQVTDGDKPLDNAMFFSRLVRRLVHFLTTQTGSGELYEIDTRLRPDGRSGLLVTSTEAFERYQDENAWTWEHQALLRARAVAGSAAIAREFERIRRETLIGRVRRDSLRDDVVSMRARMRGELDRSAATTFDLKHGRGGIGDIEFLVQYLVLREADKDADVVSYSDNIRQLDALVDADIVEKQRGERLQDIYREYRLLVHHLVLDGRKPLCGSERFVTEREFVASLWDDWLA